jgi:nitrite reductase/ring-hydroxylating ferredoxin subunit
MMESTHRDDIVGAVAPVIDGDGEWDGVGLPMPRNHSLLDPATPRLRVRTVADRFPFPIPNGWFIVAMAGDLGPGEVRSLHYFGRDLVLYRTDTGDARLLDAYCPHLGAHLGVGSRVEAGNLRCAFHGWSFDGASGRCTEIPYGPGERVPAKARVRTYPVIERGGAVWAWHHLTDGEPFFELPVVPEFAKREAWTEPLLSEFRIATSCQEMAENNHDFAHFQFVHGTPSVPVGEEVIDGTYKAVKSPGLERETFGLGLGVVRIPGMLTFLSSVTPVDEDNVHVRWLFTVPIEAGETSARFFAEQFSDGITQDIPIWENKIYRPRPVLTRSESGIAEHRNWSRQFYSDPAEEPR